VLLVSGPNRSPFGLLFVDVPSSTRSIVDLMAFFTDTEYRCAGFLCRDLAELLLHTEKMQSFAFRSVGSWAGRLDAGQVRAWLVECSYYPNKLPSAPDFGEARVTSFL